MAGLARGVGTATGVPGPLPPTASSAPYAPVGSPCRHQYGSLPSSAPAFSRRPFSLVGDAGSLAGHVTAGTEPATVDHSANRASMPSIDDPVRTHIDPPRNRSAVYREPAQAAKVTRYSPAASSLRDQSPSGPVSVRAPPPWRRPSGSAWTQTPCNGFPDVLVTMPESVPPTVNVPSMPLAGLPGRTVTERALARSPLLPYHWRRTSPVEQSSKLTW